MKPKTKQPAPAQRRLEPFERGFFEDLFASFHDSLNLMHLQRALYGPARAPRHTEQPAAQETGHREPAAPQPIARDTAGEPRRAPQAAAARAPRRSEGRDRAQPGQRRA